METQATVCLGGQPAYRLSTADHSYAAFTTFATFMAYIFMFETRGHSLETYVFFNHSVQPKEDPS